ncbi:MAG: hypothetical protein R3B82_01675 [Sandaracinaceae bacterium]
MRGLVDEIPAMLPDYEQGLVEKAIHAVAKLGAAEANATAAATLPPPDVARPPPAAGAAFDVLPVSVRHRRVAWFYGYRWLLVQALAFAIVLAIVLAFVLGAGRAEAQLLSPGPLASDH